MMPFLPKTEQFWICMMEFSMSFTEKKISSQGHFRAMQAKSLFLSMNMEKSIIHNIFKSK